MDDALDIALEAAVTGEGYIRTNTDNTITLDGRFTLEELEAILLTIKTHNTHTPER